MIRINLIPPLLLPLQFSLILLINFFMFIKFKFDRIIYIWVKKREKMLSKEVAIQVIQILGIVGFIILIFFILIAKYVKDPSERKIFIYSFIALSFFLVIWTTINMTPHEPLYPEKEEASTTAEIVKTKTSLDLNNSIKLKKEVSSIGSPKYKNSEINNSKIITSIKNLSKNTNTVRLGSPEYKDSPISNSTIKTIIEYEK